MSEDDGQEKSQEPTAKKMAEFRSKGKLAKSQEMLGMVGIIFGLGGLLLYASTLGQMILEFATSIYVQIPYTVFDQRALDQLTRHIFLSLAKMLGVPMLLLWVVVSFAGIAQNRFVLPEESIKFDPTKLNPVSGFKEKFMSMQPIVDLIKGVMKMGLIGWAVYLGMKKKVAVLPNLILEPPENILLVFWDFAFTVIVRSLPVVLLIVILDYAYQWYKVREDMMMSFQEVKDEMKQAEGDPMFKGMRRQRQREISMMRTLQEVPKADVVVANPTHFAVAIRYRKEEGDAPVVLARGLDHLAIKMRLVAKENEITVIENPPLARALHRQSKEGQQIPPEYYAAVAEILAAIYRSRGTIN